MLPFVQWASGARTVLLLIGASPNTPPMHLQNGVREGDPLGPLLFVLALQQSVQRTQVAAIAFDDVSFASRVQDLKVGFQIL